MYPFMSERNFTPNSTGCVPPPSPPTVTLGLQIVYLLLIAPTLIVNVWLSLPTLLTAFTVTVYGPACVGVQAINPEALSIVIPAG